MPIRKILPKTESSLQPSFWVTNFHDPNVKKVIQDLKDTLVQQQKDLDAQFPDEGKGVGLASNQI
jgi:peptide deformylase